MRVVIIGADGQLGTDLRRRLPQPIEGLDWPALDVCDEQAVAAALEPLCPDMVINCAARTHVDDCEDQIEQTWRVNALGALHVARQAAQLDAPVLFVSTDYVFGLDAQRSEPYREIDTPGPLSQYGASKLAGEQLTRAYNPRHFVIRTSGLYGHAGARGKGGNFVETILTRARRGESLRVVSDQRLSPTSTWSLSGRIAALVQTEAWGLYHIAAVDSCTWHEFASAIVKHEGCGAFVEPISSDAYPFKARRPALSALTSDALPAVGIEPCPPWRKMLHAYLTHRDRASVESD